MFLYIVWYNLKSAVIFKNNYIGELNFMKKRDLISFVGIVLLIMIITAACAGDNINGETNDDSALEIITETNEENSQPETEAQAETVSADDPNLQKTAAPVITGSVNTSPSTICVAGKCEKDAIITIKGGIETVSFKAADIYFMGTTELAANASVKLKITARTEGKNESEEVTLNAKYIAAAKHIRTDAFEVIVGKDSMCHFVSALPDYEGANVLESGQIKSLTSRIESKVKWLNENMSGTELIYLIVPSSTTVYPETMPPQYKQSNGVKRKDQFAEAARAAGATAIDVTDALLSHKEDIYRLFHPTDSHWTEYGAWIAYTELMNYIAEKWPDAAPRSFDEMGFYEKDVDGGDMPYYLELDYKKVREVSVFSNPKFELPITMMKHTTDHGLLMNHDTTPKARDIKSNRSNLPSAYIMRDSYGIALYDMLAERFNRTIYENMWSYPFDTDALKQYNADYIICIIAERNLGDILY